MERKSANGFQTKVTEGGAQRKQLPYSVETPYGFHLDLDFLKYVDDIEKGNTIKRVHIQRRVKGPPKFSTLPRNFSLPGHGVRPVPKEKDSTWSGTSTLGPKPKSRVTEVQQIYDIRASEGVTSSQSNRAASSQGTGFILAKARGEVAAEDSEGKIVGVQSRPNLLRASSMPITLQQRKGSDSSSPDRTMGTPESGSTENMFRASPDVTERRCVPQERTGLHQQITVALKRVRELEEQVKTIPELKAQICSLKEEREKLLLQLQTQTQAHVSTSPSTRVPTSGSATHTQTQVHRPSEGLNVPMRIQPTKGLDISECLPTKIVIEKEEQVVTVKSSGLTKDKNINLETLKICSAHGEMGAQPEQKRETQLSEKSDLQEETGMSPEEQAVPNLSQNIAGKELSSAGVRKDDEAVEEEKSEKEDSMQKLQEKLMILEAKLAHASQELDRSNVLLKEQLVENKLKEEKILQLSEEVRSEICSPEAHNRPRRESIDTGTETDRVDVANQETETELPGTIDQGTDTDKICIEVHAPKTRTGSIDQDTETSKVDTSEHVTQMEVDLAALSPPRPRANSMERGTVTERILTHDQMTETPVAERVNQVTETEGETVTDHPQRPRASGVARGTETERVDTVDRVTETEEAQRTDQETETEINRHQDNNPTSSVEAESQVIDSRGSEREENINTVVSESVKDEESQRDGGGGESVVITESSFVEAEITGDQNTVSDTESQDEDLSRQLVAGGEVTESKIERIMANNESQAKEIIPAKSDVTGVHHIPLETADQKQTAESETPLATVKETVDSDKVEVAPDSSPVKTVVPVRPQRGRKPSTDQAHPSSPQVQAAPMSPCRGSGETHAQLPQQQARVQDPPQLERQMQVSEPQIKHPILSPSQTEEHTLTKRPPGESCQKPSQSQTQTQGLSSSKVQTSKKLIQPQNNTVTKDSKELKTTLKGSSVSRTAYRGSGEPEARTIRQRSCDTQPSQGSRRSSSEMKPAQKDVSDTQSLRRAASEAAQRRDSSEAQASRRDSSEGQPTRRGSGESPTSPAALGQVVTRLTGLLGEQWAQLGSSSGTQQMASQQESPSTHKQTAGKRAEAGKGASARPAGKAVPTVTTGKQAGKPGPSKMSSIQSQLVSSLSVLSAFYSPGQKATTAGKQQEQGLKSIMKKDGAEDKQGNKRAKKNLKFVGVNGGYESTSSEESSSDEKLEKLEMEEEDSSEPEVEKETKADSHPTDKPEHGAETQQKDVDIPEAEEGVPLAAEEKERGLLDPERSQETLEEQAEREKVDKRFIDACVYVKDRMEEVSSPDKEMRQILVVLYQEWFRVSSQKDSQADTVRSYLRQVSLTTPTLLPYVVNLTDGNGNMALHYCVSHSNFPMVKLLLDTGLCEIDTMNKAGYTPVMLAALTAADSPDDLEVAQQLLTLGNVNTCSRQAGQTALMLAVSHGRVAMVKLLLSCGTDVNIQDCEGSTALMCASEHGHTHIVRLLLETGHCDLSLTDKNGQTALLVAEGASHQDVVDLMKAHVEGRASELSSNTDLP